MKNIQILRMEIGVKQKDVAEALGISKQYYQFIEAGERKATQNIKEKLSKYFGLPSGILFQEKNHIVEILKGAN